MSELQRTDLVSLLNCGIILAGMELLEEEEEEEKRTIRRRPRYWVSPYLKERNLKGRFFTDFENLQSEPQWFSENFHMSSAIFDELYELLLPHLAPKRNTRPKDFIPTKAKVAIVLEYLASGDLQRHLASCYRISKQHFGRIIDDVCEAICTTLQKEIPRWNEDMLLNVADGFRKEWNFPNCVGAIDGKHVSIIAPANSGSIFYNYKGFHSIVVLATCDAYYKFTYLDIGAYGSEGDCNIFKNSKFGVTVINDTCPFPPDAYVDGKKLPYFNVADDAFPLSKRMMKPFNSKPILPAQRIFNYRLSRARRCIENAFGILSVKWLCLRKTLFCNPNRAQKIVSACCLLHNFLLNKNPRNYCPTTFAGFEDRDGNWVDGEWQANEHREGSLMQTDLAAYHGRSSDYGKYIQKTLTEYVNSETGSVPWQNRAAFL